MILRGMLFYVFFSPSFVEMFFKLTESQSGLHWTYTQSSLIIALFAFTFDFNSRVKMLSSDKHLAQSTERPRLSAYFCVFLLAMVFETRPFFSVP